MRVLNNFNRENPYSDDLQEAYGKYVCISIDDVKEILGDVVSGSSCLPPEERMMIKEWLEEGNKPDFEDITYRRKVEKEFIAFVRANFQNYLYILNNFVREHLKEEKTIQYTLRREIKIIEEDEIPISKDEDYLIDEDVDELFIYCRNMLTDQYEWLINEIKREFQDYLGLSINEEQDEDNRKLSELVLLYDRLGIIKYLKDSHPELKNNISALGKVIAEIAGCKDKASTIEKSIQAIDPMGKNSKPFRKNNPYNSEKSIANIDAFFAKYRLKK